MKKILLTSAAVMFAASAASAANVMNDNPLYRPTAGTFYSVTDATSSFGENSFKSRALETEFGYGINDRLSVNVMLSGYWNDTTEDSAVNMWGAGVSYRYLDEKNWKADVFGSGRMISQATFWNFNQDDVDVDGDLLDFRKNQYAWQWTVGTRAGYVAKDWTVAGFAAMDYTRYSFGMADDGMWRDMSQFFRRYDLNLGLMGQYLINDKFNLVGSLTYKQNVYNVRGNAGELIGDNSETLSNARAKVMRWSELNRTVEGKLGVNYNINNDMFVGAYMTRGIVTDEVFESDIWGVGARFGVQF